MSYGWLTESALLPHKSKNIEVETKSFVDLKVNILKEKEKLKVDRNEEISSTNKTKSTTTKISFKSKNESFNEDVLTRKEKVVIQEEPTVDYYKIQEKLSKKQEIYDRFLQTRHNALNKDSKNLKSISLVDFDLKKVEHNIPLIQTINKNMKIEENPENLEVEEKVLVKQQYDNVLSKDEKKALKEVLKEEKSFKDQIMFLKRKKEKERGDKKIKFRGKIGKNSKDEEQS